MGELPPNHESSNSPCKALGNKGFIRKQVSIMKRILILGANGATAQLIVERLLQESDDQLLLFLRDAQRLKRFADNPRVTIVEGDVHDSTTLEQSMDGVDIVYSNIGGIDLADSTRHILSAMKATGRTRLIFFSAIGALHEVPGAFGEWNERAIKDYLPGFRESDTLINAEKSINTTQIRPTWLTNHDEIDYHITEKTEAPTGTEVSRKSVADVVVRLLKDPDLYPNDSIGIEKPNTEGDKPAWM